MAQQLTSSKVAQSGETDIIVRRTFDHPPTRVWRALTEPALIRQWLAPEDMKTCRMDARAGGSFTYEWPNFSFYGAIVTCEPPYRMTHIETFSEDPGYRVEVTTELAALGGGTRMTVLMRYASAEARAAAVSAGFTAELDTVYGRIDALQMAG